ncbi:hypothetical protein [Pseudomonas putida]|uniref:hypothetical protein n=1 Tax=Pseudomonas putida TaxID=303 RepID=UPI0013A70BED|nr:hypothetical protein [Pseudomonas putida]
MFKSNNLILSEQHRATLATASATFPGEKLHQVVTRTLADLPSDRAFVDFYEFSRIDVPSAFDSLLKLQNTGLAYRHIENDGEELHEILRVEATLLDAIILALALLLDVILGMLSACSSGGSKPPITTIPSATLVPEYKPSTPILKRKPESICYDGPSL